jgi:hypothetical protein
MMEMNTKSPAPAADLLGLQTYGVAEIVAIFPDGTQFAKVDDVRALLAAAPVAPACPLTQAQIEYIADQWDGCMYDAPGDTIDIGAWLRRNLAKIGGVK